MELEIIKHKDILSEDIIRVINAKSVSWPYPFESQIKWIKENLEDEDKHVFLKNGNEVVAYMNLVRITFIVNEIEYMAYGIGNVCSTEKGKGYGNKLMKLVNSYLAEVCHVGLLFCKPALVPFYQKNGWEDIAHEVCNIPSLSDDIHVMTYLIPEEVKSLSYHGKIF